MGMIEGVVKREGLEMSSSSGSGGSAASGDESGDQGGDAVNEDVGLFSEMRRDSPMPRETGLIAEMETLGARGPGNQRKHLEYIAGSG